ncbi:hypothetical protein Tco_0178338 [Tanacetum coccineum]
MAIGDPSSSNVDSINGLDGGNPLHMNPNDSTSTSLIPFKLTGPENYLYSVDVATVWKDLESTYDKVDGSIIFNMFHKISCLKQGGSSLAGYYHRLNSLWREFDALNKLPTCVCDANKELETHNKIMKLMQFLMSLDECYMSIRKEFHRGIPESSSVIETKLNATYFVAKSLNNFKRSNNNGNNNTNYTRRNNTGNGNRGPNPNLYCKNCGMIGHNIERCYELIGYPPGFKKVNNPIKQTGFKQNFNANLDVKTNDKQQSAGS